MLQVKNLSLFRNKKLLYQNLSFTMNAGECWGVLGKNGVGKSTLLLAIANLYNEYDGEILFDSNNLQTIKKREFAQLIGLMLQKDDNIFPIKVLDYVKQGRYAYQSNQIFDKEIDTNKAILALEWAGVTHLANRNITQLSGGEMRRVAFATILVQSPKLYLLDEPVSQVDIKYQHHILNHVQTVVKQENKAALIVLHDVNLVEKYCDRVIFLFENGECHVGEKKQLMSEALLERLYDYPIERLEIDSKIVYLPK